MSTKAALIIGGVSRSSGSAGELELTDPATDEVIATLPKAGLAEVRIACEAALIGYGEWSAVSPYERSKVLRRAADLMRARVEEAAQCLTREQGKPLAQSRLEWGGAADLLDWFAEEGRRTYGRVIPGRTAEADLRVLRRPVGPVAAMAGEYLKKVTMELGGHAPVIVAKDADLSKLIPLAAQWKFRNAGQVCVSPTRFLVEDAVYDDFVDGLAEAAGKVKVGHGLEEGTMMG